MARCRLAQVDFDIVREARFVKRWNSEKGKRGVERLIYTHDHRPLATPGTLGITRGGARQCRTASVLLALDDWFSARLPVSLPPAALGRSMAVVRGRKIDPEHKTPWIDGGVRLSIANGPCNRGRKTV